MVLRLSSSQPDFEQQFAAVLTMKRESAEDVSESVHSIVEAVKDKGDKALYDFTAKFDRFDVETYGLRFSENEIETAYNSLTSELLAALKKAADRIASFHQNQMPHSLDYTDDDGVRLGQQWRPVSSAGLYVPGGTANYPSSVLMNAMPAKVAGVENLVMVVPTPDGVVNPAVIAAAKLAGIHEIYRVGGAQAVAALAYGTETIPSVDKIVGPGNAFVAEAKRQVYGKVGIDAIAGPSEILVVADNTNDPRWIAADLLSQAEHDPVAQSILITDDPAFAQSVELAVQNHLRTLPRAQIASASWENYGVIIVVGDIDNSLPLVDALAPEHLELAIENPHEYREKVTHAGAIFVGRYTPEAIGDYVAGPNHVLPTARTARFSSGLSVYDFMKRTTFVECTPESLAAIGPAAITLAEEEGLQAHGLSVSIRLEDIDKQ
ncbi:histidinol dehydrogenase [Temperatibacter marinus]|uniref:Histidinol dehydrogenase n=1 Tax=Temperatibacter marinus TaxID=1456591 RepID=A0AA52HBR9_9PROT|nr:histidinol dehydrogenase [Temperatibacter marinus]WND04040.1 histidinol dehydrogenase [Temperatibacter marinus]